MSGDGARPERWDEPAASAETHISVLWLVGDRVYKMMKPVTTGFLDHATLAARSHACEREVALNRRLAPDVYLGVARLGLPDEDPEPLVAMRRMPGERRLSAILGRPEAAEQVRLVARSLADFHRAAERPAAAAAAASPAAVRRLWIDNLDELRSVLDGVLEPGAIDEIEGLALEYLHGRDELLEDRIAAGVAVDGHGDLLADDIFCLDDGPRILDCLAFSDHLRMGDALADIAFLAMDIERLGRPDLSAALLDEHAAALGVPHPASLAHHWIAYRASVRAKVACYRARQGDPEAPERARRLIDLCIDHLRRGRVRIVLVGGGPGVGKSTLARALGSEIGAAWLQSDDVRKELAGLPSAPLAATPGIDEGIYAPRMSERVYATMAERAALRARMGRSSVLDASWASSTARARARRVAADSGAVLHELECRAPDELADARIGARRAAGTSPSDATRESASVLRARRAPWPEAVPIDCSGAPADALAAAVATITSRPPPSPRAADPAH